MTFYPWVKALHVLSVLLWISGLIRVAQALRPGTSSAERSSTLDYDETWGRPAMIALWTLGFWMATKARWWIHPWFITKFAAVLAVSGLHGYWIGLLKRDRSASSESLPMLGLLALVALVVVMVVVKPA